MPQHIIVREYDPTWKEKYEKEKNIICKIVGDNLIGIYHIGSTSVPSLSAKPVIDIMVTVRSLKHIDYCTSEFISSGYEALGEFGIPGRRYFRKGGDERTHQIHVFQAEDRDNIERHLAFRDFLRTNGKAREEYAVLKKEFAIKFPWDIESYSDGKDEFIKKAEAEALTVYDPIWDRLYTKARLVQRERIISPFIETGSVAAALITGKGNIYYGICIDTACALGMCAERNAISSMLTAGESTILKIAIVDAEGNTLLPCGACQEMMMQLGKESKNIEILKNHEPTETITLKSLQKDWWGTKRF